MASLIRQLCRKHSLAERSTDALLTRDVGPIATPANSRKAPTRSPGPAGPQSLLFAAS
jgi:hypothetical protein